jgi:tetratricopeptide (TPR) repeat protein
MEEARMRRYLALVGAVLLGSSWTGSLQAGLYNAVDRAFLGVQNEDRIQSWIVQLRECRMRDRPAAKDSYRLLYEKEVARLEKKRSDHSLTTIDRAELGAYYLRLNRRDEALRTLEAGDSSHFLISLHLAATYHEMGLLDRAVSYQRQALEQWPRVWAWWDARQWAFLRKTEQYYLKLLESRRTEWRRNGGQAPPVQQVDALFPAVHFLGPSGEYEAGNIKQEELDQLPESASFIVLQLTLWRPHDNRLVWLLAELLNASGRVDVAFSLMDYLVNANGLSSWEELRRHRRILKEPGQAMAILQSNGKEKLASLLAVAWVRSPPCGSLADGIALEASCLLPALLPRQTGQRFRPPLGPQPVPVKSSGFSLDWRQLTVGFGSGIAFAVLAVLQWQEWRRRLANRRKSEGEEEEVPSEEESTPVSAPLRAGIHQPPEQER